MSTPVCGNKMDDIVSTIREQLSVYQDELDDDNHKFNQQLNSTRASLFNYIEQAIRDLNDIKRHYKEEFDYLEEENQKTCDDNKQQFNRLCISINQSQNDQRKVSKLLHEFQETFPMRPIMLHNIPQFHLQDIDMNDFIKKESDTISPALNNNDSFSTVTKCDHGSSPIIFNEQPFEQSQPQNEQSNSSFDHRSSPVAESSFVPIHSTINDDAQSPSITGSIGHSYHKQLASQNNPTTTMTETHSRSVSNASTIGASQDMVDILFKFPYENDRKPRLMAYNTDENSLLIYSLTTSKLEYVILQTRQINLIRLPYNEPLLSLGYSSSYHSFYLITKQTPYFVLFRLNNQEIEVQQELKLTDENKKINNLIAGHMYRNELLFFYKSSSKKVIFRKYNFEESTFIPSINLKNLVYEIIDFVVNTSYITLLTQLKNSNKYMLVIHDHDLHQINSFDLIDAKQPLSIVSTIQTSQSSVTTATVCDEQIQLLLFINDPKSHFIHCCTHEQYLTLIEINGFAICSLNDGNLALVANKDIRGLKVQDYLKRNQVQLD